MTEFDDFVRGLQLSLARAQKQVANIQLERMERILQVDHTGHAELLPWTFLVDSEGDSRTISVPLASMRSSLSHQVTELSIELPVAVEEEKPQPPETEGRLTLVVHKRRGFLRRQLHRLKVSLFGAQPGAAEIEVNGRLLKTLSARNEQDEGSTTPSPGQR